jgi:choline dehydrogenase
VLRQLAATGALAAVTAAEREPGREVRTEAEVLDDFRKRAGSVFHASCTCAIGADARTSVLDPHLRVRGVSALRVVDAAAFPNVTSGNTQAPTIMLAEKAADLILQDSRAPQA